MVEVHPSEKYAMLTVIERDFEYEQKLRREKRQARPHYRCRCDCGNDTTVVVYNLLNGKTRSCGCLKRSTISEIAKRQVIDLSGQCFGSLQVIQKDNSAPTGNGKHAYWICRCQKCGKKKSVRGTDLTEGRAVDCGCERWLRTHAHYGNNLTGRQFGHLSVLHRDLSTGPRNGKHARWICECNICGNTESISSHLLSIGRDRCKNCIGIPLGEAKIGEILDALKIDYLHDTASLECHFPETGGRLRFDFVVNREDGTYIIEYDGIQHFRTIPYWEGKIDLDGRNRRDLYKNEWCKEHGIPLIRIPYTHLSDISVEDLIPETSTFLLN